MKSCGEPVKYEGQSFFGALVLGMQLVQNNPFFSLSVADKKYQETTILEEERVSWSNKMLGRARKKRRR